MTNVQAQDHQQTNGDDVERWLQVCSDDARLATTALRGLLLAASEAGIGDSPAVGKAEEALAQIEMDGGRSLEKADGMLQEMWFDPKTIAASCPAPPPSGA